MNYIGGTLAFGAYVAGLLQGVLFYGKPRPATIVIIGMIGVSIISASFIK